MINYYGQYITADTEAEVFTLNGKAGDVAYATNTRLRYAYNGTLWMPNSVVQILRSTVTIDGKTTGNTLIYTMPPTVLRFVALGAHVETMSVTGTVGIPPTVSVGTNATAYNNMFTASAIGGLLTSTGLVQTNALTLAATGSTVTNAAAIYARVSTPATLFTTYTFQIDILGYYKI